MSAKVTNAPAVQRLPAACEVVPAWVRGASARRAMIILRASGCAWQRRRRGWCAHCGFGQLTTKGAALSTADLVAQVESTLSCLDCAKEHIFEVDLYNSGNFLNEAEILPDARSALVARVAKEEAVRVLLVESRPEYITAESLSRLAESIARPQPPALEIGIGLESADDRIREGYLRKGMSHRAFEGGVKRLREGGADLLAYVMLKAMPMSDQDALQDVVRTAEYVHETACKHGVRARIALQPTFVLPGTGLAADFLAGRYAPPSLRLVLEAVRRLASFGDLVVGLWDEGLHPLAAPDASSECRDCVFRSLQEFNRSQDTGWLRLAGCSADANCPLQCGIP
jgi:radical SAM enzyme (TIGR01210 family)